MKITTNGKKLRWGEWGHCKLISTHLSEINSGENNATPGDQIEESPLNKLLDLRWRLTSSFGASVSKRLGQTYLSFSGYYIMMKLPESWMNHRDCYEQVHRMGYSGN